VRRLTGQNQVPVLVVEGRAIANSSAILQEIERLRPEPRLYPEDPAARERARGLEKFFDDEVAPDLRRIFWSTYFSRPADCARMATMGFGDGTRVLWRALYPIFRPIFRRNMGASSERVAAARERLGGTFDRLESEVGASGYLVGDRFGVADLAVASVMTALLRPPEFPYPLPEPWPPELVELRESLAHRDGYRWVMQVYAKHRGTSCETFTG